MSLRETNITYCEYHTDISIMATKLDILIDDFRVSKVEQRELNALMNSHNSSEDKVQARIETTQMWHTVIGTFMIGIIIGLVYSCFGLGDTIK